MPSISRISSLAFSLAFSLVVGLVALAPIPAVAADTDADVSLDASGDGATPNLGDAAHDVAGDVPIPPNFPEDGCAISGGAASGASEFVSLMLIGQLVLGVRRRRTAAVAMRSDRLER